MKKHSFIIFLLGVYVSTQICMEFGKEFLMVGAAKLHDYNWADWLCLAVPTFGTVGVTVMAFFSKAFAAHLAKLENGNGHNEDPAKP